MQNILEAEGIIKEVNGRTIISDCYLKCSTGEVIGLFGRNGTGKSLLLKIIFGTEPAYNKAIRINHIPCPFPYKKRLIAYLPQHHFLPANMKVCDLINITVSSPVKREEVLNHELIKGNSANRVGDLSGGQQRILEILVICSLDAKFMLLDEPLVGIDPIQKEIMTDFILSQRAEKGIVITDHNYELFFDYCDQKKQIINGVLKNVASRDELYVAPLFMS